MRGPFRPIFGVFVAALAILAATAARPGIATAYVDPLAKIVAQDEAVYGSTAIEMAHTGDWITPRFLGRYALYKPPLSYWIEAASVRILGATAFALRSPSLIAGAATVALVFWWLLHAGASMSAAITGALLLLSSHLFFVLARTGLMDALLTLQTCIAMFALACDTRLESRAVFWWFSAAAGAALMTKGIAGAYPILGLIALYAISPRRPRIARIAQALGVIAIIVAPWHAIQYALHPRWFWNEYVLTEHLSFGLGAPPQAVQEPHAWFYVKRLAVLDPVLAISAIFGISRARPRAAIAWMLVVIAAILGFAYHNTSYLMPLLPAMAIVAALAIPARAQKPALVAVAIIFLAKALMPALPWGLPFTPESTNPSQAVLKSYADRHRPNALILIEPDDEFYSADLSLPRVRYCYLDPRTERRKFPLDFDQLGIVMTASQFAQFDNLRPMFAARLREWGLPNDDALATTILARSGAEIAAMISSHPEIDFYVPAVYALGAVSHVVQPGANGRVLLLEKEH